ncbi:MAG: hypothetical protein ABI315_10940 [Bacteroidia bacterium]
MESAVPKSIYKTTHFLNSFLIPLIAIILLAYANNIKFGKNQYKSIIVSDGKGYYAYLPAIFIYHDLHFNFFDQIEHTYYDSNSYYDYRVTYKNAVIDKYYVGTALAMLPFFAVAHAYCKYTGIVADGYAKPYPVMISIAAIFYLCLGIFYLKKWLQSYSFESRIVNFILIAFVFGTHLFFYTIGEPAMSHVFSFTVIACWLYVTRRAIRTNNKRYYFFSALLFGWILLIRPVNGLVILSIPFLADGWEQLISSIKKLFKQSLFLVSLILSALFIFSIQAIIYKIQTGQWWVYSYNEEGFNWLEPHFFDILFSYKKGLFLYTPLLFISLLGFIPLFKKDKQKAVALFSFLIIVIYVLSCWWNWYYGGSFSGRPFVEYLPFFALLMAYALQYLSNWKRIKQLYIVLISLLIVFCQIQTYQYRYLIIHWDQMNKEKYWDVFLKMN